MQERKFKSLYLVPGSSVGSFKHENKIQLLRGSKRQYSGSVVYNVVFYLLSFLYGPEWSTYFNMPHLLQSNWQTTTRLDDAISCNSWFEKYWLSWFVINWSLQSVLLCFRSGAHSFRPLLNQKLPMFQNLWVWNKALIAVNLWFHLAVFAILDYDQQQSQSVIGKLDEGIYIYIH